MPNILAKCPENYELNRDNCRCKKIKQKAPKVKKTKKAKKQNVKKTKCSKDKIKACLTIEKVCNPETGRCKKPEIKKKAVKKTVKKGIKKTVKKKKVKKTVKKKFRKINLTKKNTRKNTLTKPRSYSPTINQKIKRLNQTPHYNLFEKCNENQIFIPNKNAIPDPVTGFQKGKCFGWKTKKAKQYLLENLQSTKTILPANIIGPYQRESNCWFNTFFMMFFISDKGRKFMKSFRESMITGVITTTGKKIPDSIRYPFWLLNRMITASLVGAHDPEMWAGLMNTNDVIQNIYDKLKIYNRTHVLDFNELSQPGEAGNPIHMFESIVSFFNNQYSVNNFGVTSFFFSEYNVINNLRISTSREYNRIKKNKPHILILQLFDAEGLNGTKNGKKVKVKDIKKNLKYKFGNLEYTLDSVGIRDNEKHHIVALITLNGEDYVFDGENYLPIRKLQWKKNLNKNTNMKITLDGALERYNLTKGYQCLLYYRTK